MRNLSASYSHSRHQVQSASKWNALLRIFVSEHKWKDGQPTEEEAHDLELWRRQQRAGTSHFHVCAGYACRQQKFIPRFKAGERANYKALDIVLDKLYPGYRISASTILHFGPPAGILLAAETTKDFSFVGMPPGTILLLH
jgi:hypothetical protein